MTEHVDVKDMKKKNNRKLNRCLCFYICKAILENAGDFDCFCKTISDMKINIENGKIAVLCFCSFFILLLEK